MDDPLALMILGLLPWVDNYAHTFGFIGGLLLSFALFPFINFDSSAESANSEAVKCHILRCASTVVFIGLLVTMQLVFYLLPDFQCEVSKDHENIVQERTHLHIFELNLI